MTLALLGLHLAVTGVLLPRRLAGHARLQARPALGAALWLALMASFTVALVLAAHHALEPAAHEPAGLLGLLHHLEPTRREPTGPVVPHTHDWWQLAAAGAALAGLLATVGVRAGRARRRHRAVLDVVAVRDGRWGALVLEHAHPTVYCLPGRRSRVVLSRGALRLLDERQLAAAVAHEHGHIRGRHHLLRLPADTFALLLGRLPLARLGRTEVALLLEMAADDAALAEVSRGELASALYALASGTAASGTSAAGSSASGAAPEGSLGAASTGVLARVRRLARPGGGRRRQLAGWLWVLTLPALPYLLACAPHP
ncbi:M56 family metallopeptidase [Streptomyces sp. FH025]|uniref:M56 family metallopeptidase n=1 Tax=Streptomyces sp. FH025 TaxID=2815937 RepID=UPI001A9E7AC6|nr:M56 family metallopeptidase [Streptomyces sp. FH025]MBO1416879.1 M56 family metallopeptidase [Streptomyces sp. FH025]